MAEQSKPEKKGSFDRKRKGTKRAAKGGKSERKVEKNSQKNTGKQNGIPIPP